MKSSVMSSTLSSAAVTVAVVLHGSSAVSGLVDIIPSGDILAMRIDVTR